jgi:hypothetical protein
MTVRQGTHRSENRGLRNGRSSAVRTTSRVVKKKKNRNLKQIFVLSIDSLRERKVRSALTILMVVVGGALMVAINAISAGSAAPYRAYLSSKRSCSCMASLSKDNPGSRNISRLESVAPIAASGYACCLKAVDGIFDRHKTIKVVCCIQKGDNNH